MPELAEVAYHSSVWKRSIGEHFSVAWVHERARCCRNLEIPLLNEQVNSASLVNGYTHGKRMLFEFDFGSFLEVHLGMTGSLHRMELGYEGEKHDHLVLKSEESLLVFRDPRMFGKLALHHESAKELPQWWRDLPPEPHARSFTKARFESMLSRRNGSVVKPLLLKQELFPGVGNWMADEILWQARIRPDRKFGSLSEAERETLFHKTKWVCREALKTIGVDYRDPPKSWLFSHRWKDGGICPVSKSPLQRLEVGGRTTCWSPAIQK